MDLQSTYYRFRHLFSYRTHRLRIPETPLSPRRRNAVHKILRNIPPKVCQKIISTGQDLVMVLYFIELIVNEFDTREVHEA